MTRVDGRAADGFSHPYVAAVAYGSAFYGFRRDPPVDRRGAPASRARASLAGIVVWLGTPLLFYMYVSPPYSHACSAFAVALFVTIWLHVRERWSVGGAIALGLSGALMAMVREQDVFLALGPAVDFVATHFVSRRLCQHYQSSRGPTPARGSLAPSRSAAAAGAADTASESINDSPARPVLPGQFWSPLLAASPSLLACSPSFSPTRRSTAASGRRRSSRGR